MAIAPMLNEEEVGLVRDNRNSVEFGRAEFLEIVHVEDPRILYKGLGTHFFFLAGLAVCTSECMDDDFGKGRVLLPWVTQAVR
jgi:hypothetical protein